MGFFNSLLLDSHNNDNSANMNLINRRNTLNLENTKYKDKDKYKDSKNINNSFNQRYDNKTKRKKVQEPAFFRIHNDSTLDSDKFNSNKSYERLSANNNNKGSQSL